MRADAAENRKKIIDAYLDLLRPRGPEPTISDVAASADVSRVTLYRHFDDRDDLRHAAFMHILDHVDEMVHATIAPSDPTNRPIEAQLTDLIDGFFGHGMRIHLLLNGQDYFEPGLVRGWASWLRPIVRFMQAAQDRGDLRDDLPPRWLVDVLLSLVQAVIVYPHDLPGRNATQVVLTTFLRGAEPKAVGPGPSAPD